VDGLVVDIEAHEPQQLRLKRVGIGVGIVAGLFSLGDPDAAIMHEISDDIRRYVGQCRDRLGVLFDSVPDIHVTVYHIYPDKIRGDSGYHRKLAHHTAV